MSKVIEVQGLSKRYGTVQAVERIDFYVDQGKLFAFLGPNGAGKSTTIDILCTLLTPDSGEVLIGGHTLGKENDAIRSQIGVVFQENTLDKLLTVRENLRCRAGFYGGKVKGVSAAIDRAAKATDIEGFLDRPYGKLSGGQRRRADIARALVHTPGVLFLDEPTTGLDPQTRQSVWNTIAELQRQRGMTVFFSTHYMEEAAKADYIIIIDHGKISARGTPPELKERYTSDVVKLLPLEKEALTDKLRGEGKVFVEKDGYINVTVHAMDETLALLNGNAPLLSGFEVVRGTMDDVFINVTGAEVRENA